MRRVITLLGILCLAALVGCSSTTTPPKPVDIPDAAKTEKLLWSSASERPAWTMEEPETVNGIMTFVGLSNRFATEQGAREDARRNAMDSVVKYMGTLVKNKFEKATVSFGLESNVIDPTAGSRAFEKQLATNLATQVKMKSWYMEKWQTATGVGYQAFVFSQVPMAAVDESYKKSAKDMQDGAEKRAKDAADEVAKNQAQKAADFWKQMQEQGVAE